jgi:hypothetical protein
MDEASIVEKCYKKKKFDVVDLYEIDERYNRYLREIICWKVNDTDYTYIQSKIYECINIPNNDFNLNYKIKLMRYIDGEIMMLINMIMMNDTTL